MRNLLLGILAGTLIMTGLYIIETNTNVDASLSICVLFLYSGIVTILQPDHLNLGFIVPQVSYILYHPQGPVKLLGNGLYVLVVMFAIKILYTYTDKNSYKNTRFEIDFNEEVPILRE